jgi:hypothetical protein
MVKLQRGPEAAVSQAAIVVGMLAGAAALGVITAAGQRGFRSRDRSADGPAALRSYLADHLTGSDAAFAVVARLKDAQPDGAEAELFVRLHREFAEERAIVGDLLETLGGSPFKIKRLAGQAAGVVLQAAAGGEPGDLALFRTLESLAVGVQGKRCLWRVAQRLEPGLRPPAAKSFKDLEQQAIDQWQDIEDCRLSLASRTFGAARDRSAAASHE